jgi:hypothetical protein
MRLRNERGVKTATVLGSGLQQPARGPRAVAVLFAVALVAGGCWDPDRRELQRWAQRLIDGTTAPVEVRRCAMFQGTRNGYCLVGGRAADVAAFVERLGLEPRQEPRGYSGSCMSLDGYGVSASAPYDDGSSRVRGPLPGTARFAPPRSTVPPGEGPRFLALMVAPSAEEACLELRF